MNLDFFEQPAVKQALQEAEQMFRAHAAQTGLDQDPTLQAVMEGLTIAQAKGLTRDDLDVLYEFGFNMLTGNQLQKAEDIFIQLCVIDPLEAKNHYCLGVTRQMKSEWTQAIEDFSRFLAMDATNPEGYLRMAECHTALGDKSTAAELLDIAMAEARKGNGPEHVAEQIERAQTALGSGVSA